MEIRESLAEIERGEYVTHEALKRDLGIEAYPLLYARRVQRKLKQLPQSVTVRIVQALEDLPEEENPHQHVKRLTNSHSTDFGWDHIVRSWHLNTSNSSSWQWT